jgi:hypothetical protein
MKTRLRHMDLRHDDKLSVHFNAKIKFLFPTISYVIYINATGFLPQPWTMDPSQSCMTQWRN